MREREERHLRGEEMVERGEVEAALAVGTEHGEIFERRTAGARGLLPRDEI